MFKRHALQVQMVKTPKENNSETTVQCNHWTPEAINKILKENMKHTAIALVTVIASIVVLNTVSEIAINAAPINN